MWYMLVVSQMLQWGSEAVMGSQVNSNKVPLRPSHAIGNIRSEEELIGIGNNHGRKRDRAKC
jgi:hypothetical protein